MTFSRHAVTTAKATLLLQLIWVSPMSLDLISSFQKSESTEQYQCVCQKPTGLLLYLSCNPPRPWKNGTSLWQWERSPFECRIHTECFPCDLLADAFPSDLLAVAYFAGVTPRASTHWLNLILNFLLPPPRPNNICHFTL